MYVRTYVCMHIYVYVCVCERERDREREGGREGGGERERDVALRCGQCDGMLPHMYPPPHMTHMYPPPHMHSGQCGGGDACALSRGNSLADSMNLLYHSTYSRTHATQPS